MSDVIDQLCVNTLRFLPPQQEKRHETPGAAKLRNRNNATR